MDVVDVEGNEEHEIVDGEIQGAQGLRMRRKGRLGFHLKKYRTTCSGSVFKLMCICFSLCFSVSVLSLCLSLYLLLVFLFFFHFFPHLSLLRSLLHGLSFISPLFLYIHWFLPLSSSLYLSVQYNEQQRKREIEREAQQSVKWSELLLQLAVFDRILHQPLPRLPAATLHW